MVDSVEAGRHCCGEDEVRVAAAARHAVLDKRAAGVDVFDPERHVAVVDAPVGRVRRPRLVEMAVAVDGGGTQSRQCPGVLDEACYPVADRRREIVVATRVVKDIVVAVPQGMVKVQAAARQLNARLRHECGTQTALLEEFLHAFLRNDSVVN